MNDEERREFASNILNYINSVTLPEFKNEIISEFENEIMSKIENENICKFENENICKFENEILNKLKNEIPQECKNENLNKFKNEIENEIIESVCSKIVVNKKDYNNLSEEEQDKITIAAFKQQYCKVNEDILNATDNDIKNMNPYQRFKDGFEFSLKYLVI